MIWRTSLRAAFTSSYISRSATSLPSVPSPFSRRSETARRFATSFAASSASAVSLKARPSRPSPFFSFSVAARTFATAFVRSPQSASSFAVSRPSVPSPRSMRAEIAAAFASVCFKSA